MVSMHSLFSIPVFSEFVADYKVFEEMIDLDYSRRNCSKHWLSKTPTTSFSEVVEGWEKTFVDSIKPIFSIYLQEIGIDNATPEFMKPWINFYDNGDYQEHHNHMPWHFSYAYMHKIPEKSGDFLFYNSGYQSESVTYPWNKFIGYTKKIKLQEKMILFFPSFFVHTVTKNETHKTRTTISGNISLVENKK